MVEVFLVFGGIVLAAVFGLLVPMLPVEWVIEVAAWGVVAGLAVGVPAGFVYHLRLRAALVANACLPARWWIHPSGLHDRLSRPQRRVVLHWFRIGGAGFGLVVLGCLVITAAVLLGGFHADAV